MQRGTTNAPATKTDKSLRILIAYALLTIPFVEWPGSVIKSGFPEFLKAIVFYYFTVAFVRSEQDLKRFIAVFIGCQAFRILEPLYLHITEGYWGSAASMEGGAELMSRLSGAPYDVVNPNGLAFVVCSILPFLFFLGKLSWRLKLLFIPLAALALYVLALTGSRTGLIGAAIVLLGIILKSKKRVALATVAVAIVATSFSFLSPDMQDRYLSIVGKGERNVGTAEERFEGMSAQFRVVLRRPLFGHGLGTSAEANVNFIESGPYANRAQPAHNLYLEIGEELGVVGLVIYLIFLVSVISDFLTSVRAAPGAGVGPLLPRLLDAMQVWLPMNLAVSFASYGLSGYDWYLFGGLSVVILRLSRPQRTAVSQQLPWQRHQRSRAP